MADTEKTPFMVDLSSSASPRHQRREQQSVQRTFRRRLAVAAVFLLLYYGLFCFGRYSLRFLPQRDAPTRHHPPEDESEFNWIKVPTLKHLSYQPCFADAEVRFECARLSVPLDHFNNTSDSEVSLAVIRLPAQVPPTHKQYGGAILFNPGGPGGSGVGFLQRAYKTVSAAIHEGKERNDTKFYDFISFDPRGVGESSPQVSCFTSSSLSWAWDLRVMTEGILGSSDAAFGRLWSMSRALRGSCSLAAKHHPEDIKKYVSTASVAADMLEIVEKHGEWREGEARRLLAQAASSAVVVPEHLKYRPGHEMINYWGFSYGTYLGMTFATMFPDRIDRLIVDGVVDAIDYTKALWFDNLADTEKEMRSFYSYCARAGYPACALANINGETLNTTVETRVTKIVNSLIHNPLPVIGSNPELATYSDARNLIFAGLYTPLRSFPQIASVLRDIEDGDGSSLAAIYEPLHQPYCPSSPDADLFYDKPPRNGPHATLLAEQASMAISCSDGDSHQGETREQFKKHWERLMKLSPTIGPMWAMLNLRCIHYTVRAVHRYAGPWTGNTSFPLLFIGNSADPVTPVRSAYKMSKGYNRAKVLEQGSSGHCSVAAQSRCTKEIVYKYFQHGELPSEDTFCDADEVPFGQQTIQAEDISSMVASHLSSGLGSILMPMI